MNGRREWKVTTQIREGGLAGAPWRAQDLEAAFERITLDGGWSFDVLDVHAEPITGTVPVDREALVRAVHFLETVQEQVDADARAAAEGHGVDPRSEVVTLSALAVDVSHVISAIEAALAAEPRRELDGTR